MVATLRQPSESPTQSESWTTPVAGMASPRFSWAADMVLALDASGFHHGNHPQSWCYGQGNHIFLAPKMQTFRKILFGIYTFETSCGVTILLQFCTFFQLNILVLGLCGSQLAGARFEGGQWLRHILFRWEKSTFCTLHLGVSENGHLSRESD